MFPSFSHLTGLGPPNFSFGEWLCFRVALSVPALCRSETHPSGGQKTIPFRAFHPEGAEQGTQLSPAASRSGTPAARTRLPSGDPRGCRDPSSLPRPAGAPVGLAVRRSSCGRRSLDGRNTVPKHSPGRRGRGGGSPWARGELRSAEP